MIEEMGKKMESKDRAFQLEKKQMQDLLNEFKFQADSTKKKLKEIQSMKEDQGL